MNAFLWFLQQNLRLIHLPYLQNVSLKRFQLAKKMHVKTTLILNANVVPFTSILQYFKALNGNLQSLWTYQDDKVKSQML
jgi:hypothetical protein